MVTNASITIYNRYLVSGVETYQRTQVLDVYWSNGKARNTLASGGNIASDQASIYIPYARGAMYADPKVWLALIVKTGKWTLQTGDYVVKGLVTDEISSGFTISALKAKYDYVLQISSVDPMLAGSQSIRHWQIGAK